MTDFDLTPKICAHLDRHLIFPLLQFLKKYKVHAHDEIVGVELRLARQTSMLGYIEDLNRETGSAEDLESRKTQLRSTRDAILGEFKELSQLLESVELVKQLRADKQFTAQYLAENYNINADQIEALYKWGKLQFETGQYPEAALALSSYRSLTTNTENAFQALWGKLAAEILSTNWDNALEDLQKLKEAVDAKVFPSPLVQLQQRTWLVHWSLFVFFKHPNGRNGIMDLFFHDKYLTAIQTSSPHLLRYLATAVITNKRRRNVLKRLVDVIQQERYTYKDPITELVECLYVHFDFTAAQTKLRECEAVLQNDFFLRDCVGEFIDASKLFIFETYCRIHQCIDISWLAQKLELDRDEAEKWIVNLIRNARLDAKIDSKANQVVMNVPYPSVYAQVREKTKGLSFRTQAMTSAAAPRAVADELTV
eukprot:TRINITY_DN13292_c0_g1_i1.p1 TRINITY_DN13292_c0_g1~~TRINITY_DN13292_c0_g1_i1.p1  ORF type:complete len:437 (-),score=116.99 TRINITY_DN13292_c0_g1_i1:27-1298(-)